MEMALSGDSDIQSVVVSPYVLDTQELAVTSERVEPEFESRAENRERTLQHHLMRTR